MITYVSRFLTSDGHQSEKMVDSRSLRCLVFGSILFFSIISVEFATPRRICFREDDQDEKRVSLILSIKTTLEQANLQDLIGDVIVKLTEPIDGLNYTVQVHHKNDSTLEANVTLTSERELNDDELPLMRDLLRSLDRFIDCRGDQRVNRGLCTFTNLITMKSHIYSQLPTASAVNGFLTEGMILYLVQVKLFNFRDPTGSQLDADLCVICGWIRKVPTTPSTTTGSKLLQLWNETKRLSLAFIHLMEPKSWFYLILAIWLTCCLVIAIIIKRRDRRHLHLYLEERTDYSFSAKR